MPHTSSKQKRNTWGERCGKRGRPNLSCPAPQQVLLQPHGYGNVQSRHGIAGKVQRVPVLDESYQGDIPWMNTVTIYQVFSPTVTTL